MAPLAVAELDMYGSDLNMDAGDDAEEDVGDGDLAESECDVVDGSRESECRCWASMAS
jgi:hypothetical protein